VVGAKEHMVSGREPLTPQGLALFDAMLNHFSLFRCSALCKMSMSAAISSVVAVSGKIDQNSSRNAMEKEGDRYSVPLSLPSNARPLH
jgi:hypothetical protein